MKIYYYESLDSIFNMRMNNQDKNDIVKISRQDRGNGSWHRHPHLKFSTPVVPD